MDMIRVHVWNTKKKPDEPDLLVAIGDSKGIAALLRNAWKGD